MVARVAEALNVTQPAISKQINELEKLVGAQIVKRERNRLFLTPIGIRLAEHARQVLNQIDRAAFDIEAMSSGTSGSIAIGSVSSVSPIILPAPIALLKRSAPEANISVIEGHFVSLFPLLESGAIDLLMARIWQPQELPGIEQMVLMQEPIDVVARRDHPLVRCAKDDWAEAVTWPWILSQANSIARQAVDALFADYGLAPPTNTIASLSLTLNLEIMKQIPALGFFPRSLAQTHASRGDIAVLPLETKGLLSEARCFWRQSPSATNSTFDLFMKCLQQTRP